LPKYFTYKKDVKLAPGQTLKFQAGRGYYAYGFGTPSGRRFRSIPIAPRGILGGPDDMPSPTKKAVFYQLTKKK